MGKHAFKFGGEYRPTTSKAYSNVPAYANPSVQGGAGTIPGSDCSRRHFRDRNQWQQCARHLPQQCGKSSLHIVGDGG